MRRVLFIGVILTASAAQAEIYQGYQRAPQQPAPKGYVTEDGKRYGTCRNYHHRPHKHCKDRVPLPKPPPPRTKPPPAAPPAESKLIRIPNK